MSQEKLINEKTNLQKRYLIISPDVKYWDLSKPLIFCGDYCINQSNEHLLEKVDYKILDDKVFNYEFNLDQIKYCDKIYENLLSEISSILNRLHNINWSLRSWRIFIGPWLNRYVSIINNRLNLIKYSSSFYEIHFKKIKFIQDSLISYDLRDFTDKAVNHEWNEKLIRRLNEIYKTKNFDFKYLNNVEFEKFRESNYTKYQIFLRYIKNKINLLWNFLPFTKNNNFFFHKIYIGDYFTSLKLFLGLKNFPVKYFLNDQRFKKEFNLNLRSKIKLNCKVENLNEKIIRYLLVELLPTIYLEGFKYLKDELKKSHLPSSPKTIFTSNCSQDTIFKFWLSEKVNNGSNYSRSTWGCQE